MLVYESDLLGFHSYISIFDCNSYNFYYFYRKLILKAYGTMRKSNRSANLNCCPLKNYF